MSHSSAITALRIADEGFLVASTIERCPKTMMIRELFTRVFWSRALSRRIYRSDSLKQGTRARYTVNGSHHVGCHLIACIFDAGLSDLFRFTERSTHVDNRGMVFFGPRFPGSYSILLPCAAFFFRKSVPC
jgi:hypothetical protein